MTEGNVAGAAGEKRSVRSDNSGRGEKVEGYLSCRTEKGKNGRIIARALSGKIILGDFREENCLGVTYVEDQGTYYTAIEHQILVRPADDPQYCDESEWCVAGNYPEHTISYGHCWVLRSLSVVIPVETGLKKVKK